MKKQTLILLLAIAMSSITCPLYAQESSNKAGYDLKKNVKCRVVPTESGAMVSFNYSKIEYNVKSPRDAASGQASGKRQHKPFNFIVSSADNTVSEVKSPRDVATGQSSGKVSYSDLSVMISLEKSSVGKFKPQKIMIENDEFILPPDLPNGNYDLVMSWSWGANNSGTGSTGTGMGQGRAAFTITMEDGVAMAISEQGMPAKKK